MFKHYLTYIGLFTSSIFLSACGGGNITDLLDEGQTRSTPIDANGRYAGDVAIDILQNSPTLSVQPDDRTNVVLQFIPRDSNGLPLSSNQIDIELRVNGKSISVESRLESTASELEFNVNFGLVLDASYSMVAREAFTPMLNAASRSVQSGIGIWEKNSGEFNFYTTWFNDFISSADENWSAADIKSISAPVTNVNNSTKLFSAIDFMVNKLNALPKANKSEKTPADQNIILVFSDGKDEFSWSGKNANSEPEYSFTDNGSAYTTVGYKSTSLNKDLIPNIKQSENLTVHVIGLGNTIVEEDLSQIAKAGGGTFQKNPNADNLNTIFDRVAMEFTTLQTQGASLTLPPGEYSFSLRLKNKAGSKFVDYNFDFITNENGASIKQVIN